MHVGLSSVRGQEEEICNKNCGKVKKEVRVKTEREIYIITTKTNQLPIP